MEQELAVVYSSKSISLRLFLRVASERYAYCCRLISDVLPDSEPQLHVLCNCSCNCFVLWRRIRSTVFIDRSTRRQS